MSGLLERVEETIRARKLLRRGQKILVAVSGGLDSTVLLHLLHALAPRHRWRLVVAHFNHRLRGRASDGDERFVRRLAARLHLPCLVGRAEVRAQAREQGVSLEMAARELRHRFLAETARKHGIGVVALAHHADDQVELFFLRLLRGAGPEGLCGMKWRAPSPADPRVQLARPILDVGRKELEQFAREQRIRYREDASNAALDILRNRIRHELLPLLRRRYQPAVARTVLRLMELLGEESALVNELTRALERTPHKRAFTELPVAVQRRRLREGLERLGIAPEFALIERLRLHLGRKVSAPDGRVLFADATGQVIESAAAPADFDWSEQVVELKGRAGEALFDGVRIRWRLARPTGAKPRAEAGRECFDAEQVGGRVLLRHWRPGDRYQPIGMGAAVKLQDWFTNRKIPAARRRALLVATTAEGEIFWVEGERIAEGFKVTPRTRRCLLWRWQRGKSRIAASAAP
ncbi:MAG: tRNA lysidine(34) synthetase TilS [Verrucomicrobiae bacterium]|nr:tRNA lysidine(34) synthetase TilS [Verrucomicrobiae bacterium]